MSERLRQTDSAEMLSARQTDLLVRQIQTLPISPAVSAALAEMLDADTSCDGLAELVACDPAMAAEVLRRAPSGPDEPLNLARATAAVGAETLREILLSTGPIEGQANGEQLSALTKHGRAVAIAAEILAERLALPIDLGEAYACGLLHDIGKLAMLAVLPKSYGRLLAGGADSPDSSSSRERRMLGIDHTLFGRRLAEQWKLGELVQHTAWLHHQPIEAIPQSIAERRLIGVVRLADALASCEGFSAATGAGGSHASPLALAEAVDLSEADLSEVAATLVERMEQIELRLEAAPTHRPRPATSAGDLAAQNAKLQRQIQAVAQQAKAFESLADMAGRLAGESTVADALVQAVRALADVLDLADTDLAVAAYCVDDETQELLLARLDSQATPALRTLACDAGSASNGLAGESLERILANPEDLAEWADLLAGHHQPMHCGGKWIGGLIIPPARADQQLLGPLSDVLAMALSLVQGRCNAVRLGEQLTSAAATLGETQSALADAQTLAAAGEMAAGAAHEMNTPLAIVSGRAQLMLQRASTDEDRKLWGQIVDQTQRVTDTITALMEFAAPAQPAPEFVAPAELVQEAFKQFSSTSPQAALASVDISIAAELPALWVDRRQLRAAIAELIANAANAATAAAADGPICVSARHDQVSSSVVISVTDAGAGMDGRTLEQAFTPFFSAHKAGRRSGLGLPQVKRYAEINGGRVWIRSRTGKGTTVYLQVPTKHDSHTDTDSQQECPPGASRPGG